MRVRATKICTCIVKYNWSTEKPGFILIMTDITRKERSKATHKSGIEKLFQDIQEIRTDSKLAELIANKQTVLDKIKRVKALDAEILDLVKDDEIEGEIEKATDLELFCNEELFKVDHFVKDLEEKKKTKSSGYPTELPAV